MGLASTDFIRNNGSVLVMYFVYTVLVLFTLFIRLFLHSVDSCLVMSDYLRKKLFYGSLITIMFETQLITQVSLFVGYEFMSTGSVAQLFQSVLVIGFTIVTLSVPLILYIHLMWNVRSLR